MRLLSLPAMVLPVAVIILTSPLLTSASPLGAPPEERDETSLQNSTLAARCENPCGWTGQLCCDSGETCITNADDQAECIAGGGGGRGQVTAAATGGGYWATYTTTWVETDLVTRTSVYSSYVGGGGVVTAQATATRTPQCDYAANESPCGSICCSSGQYCYTSGQCMDAGNGGSSGGVIGGAGSVTRFTTFTLFTTFTSNGATFSAPLRPTTGTMTIVTRTVSPTTTVPFQTPVETGANMTTGGPVEESRDDGGSLSGGAIAGIVIGVLVGLALLALLCFCCIARGLWALVVGIFGLNRRNKRRVEETYISEHHHDSVSGAGAGRRWYGDRPARPDRPEKRSRWGGVGAVAAGLGALGLGLMGKRAYDRRKARRDEKSDISSSYYYDYSDYTSNSSPSSVTQDRRTRRSSRPPPRTMSRR